MRGFRDAEDAAALLLPVLERSACALEAKSMATHTPEVDGLGLAAELVVVNALVPSPDGLAPLDMLWPRWMLR